MHWNLIHDIPTLLALVAHVDQTLTNKISKNPKTVHPFGRAFGGVYLWLFCVVYCYFFTADNRCNNKAKKVAKEGFWKLHSLVNATEQITSFYDLMGCR